MSRGPYTFPNDADLSAAEVEARCQKLLTGYLLGVWRPDPAAAQAAADWVRTAWRPPHPPRRLPPAALLGPTWWTVRLALLSHIETCKHHGPPDILTDAIAAIRRSCAGFSAELCRVHDALAAMPACTDAAYDLTREEAADFEADHISTGLRDRIEQASNALSSPTMLISQIVLAEGLHQPAPPPTLHEDGTPMTPYETVAACPVCRNIATALSTTLNGPRPEAEHVKAFLDGYTLHLRDTQPGLLADPASIDEGPLDPVAAPTGQQLNAAVRVLTDVFGLDLASRWRP